MTSPFRIATPSCVSAHVSTPARSARGVARSSRRRASRCSWCSFDISRPSPSTSVRFAIRAFSRDPSSCVSSICAWETASSDFFSSSCESRPSAASWRSRASCDRSEASCSVFTSTWPFRSMRLFSRDRRVRACWFCLMARSCPSLSTASCVSLMSSVTRGSPFSSLAPVRFRMRSTRASTGLETTCSTSGTTVPVAVITASIGPASATDVRTLARLMDGLYEPGQPHEGRGDDGEDRPTVPARRTLCLRCTSSSIGRSTSGPPVPGKGKRAASQIARFRSVFGIEHVRTSGLGGGCSEADGCSTVDG